MRRRVVITGLGVLTSLGIGKDAFWDALVHGKSGIRKISTFDTSHLRSHIAGEINGFDPLEYIDRKEVATIDRVCQFSIAASELAVRDSRIRLDKDAGVVVGTGLGGIITDDAQHQIYHAKGPRFVHPLTIPMSMYNASACHISQRFGIKGPGFTLSTACSSGTHAIGEAYRLIKDGYADVNIAGGSEATLSQGIFSAWCAMRILSRRNDTPEQACRPYSKDRDGMVLGEGAGFVILEELSRALKRDAPIYAEIIGYGSSYDASHLTAPDVHGQAMAIDKAIRGAEIRPEEVDYINGHGTGTSLNDKIETDSAKMIFGQSVYSIPMSSIKPQIGHTLGASGALGLIASCLSLRDNLIPATINYTEPDPECDLDYVPNTARKANLNIVMTNSFGFGGNNGVLVTRRFTPA
jgi:3-oxoacyl-[acyl-carrier-protein] synthase II